ncbi:hypothetical protein [Paenibacillus sp. GCM10027626]|uniref:hypothetical protein n=1 Tax=Paenibacillus sp. GCM10027626 TaxID=3273411 RepID=UPI0036380CEC
MNTFLIDFFVNAFESIAGFVLILAIFMFPVRTYLIPTIFAAIVMAQTSYLAREVLNLDSITPLLMLGWIIVVIWMLFRVHIFYALLMAVTGYVCYGAMQLILIFLCQFFIDLDTLTTGFNQLKVIQIITSTVSMIIAIIFIKKRIGFSFVPDRKTEKVTYIGVNRILLYVLIGASLIIAAVSYFVHDGKFSFLLYIFSFILVILIVLYLAIWKERRDID